jgi:hypothetical protein
MPYLRELPVDVKLNVVCAEAFIARANRRIGKQRFLIARSRKRAVNQRRLAAAAILKWEGAPHVDERSV